MVRFLIRCRRRGAEEQSKQFTQFHNYVACPRSEAFRIEYWALGRSQAAAHARLKLSSAARLRW